MDSGGIINQENIHLGRVFALFNYFSIAVFQRDEKKFQFQLKIKQGHTSMKIPVSQKKKKW